MLSSIDPPNANKCTCAPPELIELLEKFANCAIKAQPPDLLSWTKKYFDDLNSRKRHSIKEKLKSIYLSELQVITPELLRVLHASVGGNPTVKATDLQNTWMRLNLPKEVFETIISAGYFSDQIEWLKFFALACYCLGKTITSSLKIACKTLSSSQRSHQPIIPFSTFQFLYQYLASVDERVSAVHVQRTLNVLRQEIIGPDGLIKMSDFMNNPRVKLE
ncbi:ropporin-1-like isoform X2 [Ambystoma mexicanum]|uniref:ropporin-1-like isoform X2 n=1 Tax=Ambystoma mexicanum TaxID=8296 RepID=UPI0037E9C58E